MAHTQEEIDERKGARRLKRNTLTANYFEPAISAVNDAANVGYQFYSIGNVDRVKQGATRVQRPEPARLAAREPVGLTAAEKSAHINFLLSKNVSSSSSDWARNVVEANMQNQAVNEGMDKMLATDAKMYNDSYIDALGTTNENRVALAAHASEEAYRAQEVADFKMKSTIDAIVNRAQAVSMTQAGLKTTLDSRRQFNTERSMSMRKEGTARIQSEIDYYSYLATSTDDLEQRKTYERLMNEKKAALQTYLNQNRMPSYRLVQH